MKKECWEEAGVPKELAAQARPVGAVSYAAMQSAGLKRDVLFCYDLELPLEFVPTPQVGLQGSGGWLVVDAGLLRLWAWMAPSFAVVGWLVV